MALDPVLLQMVSQIPVPSGEIDYVALREQAAQIAPLLYGQEGPIEVASVDEQSLTVDGTAIPMRIYRPTTPARGTLHFYHGGGWVGGDLAIIDPVARRSVDGSCVEHLPPCARTPVPGRFQGRPRSSTVDTRQRG